MTINLSEETQRLVQEKLGAGGFGTADEVVRAAFSDAYVRSRHLMMLVTDHGFLDVFDYVPGEPDASVQALFGEAVEHDGTRYASLPWLLRMKRAAGRPKDLSDLEHLGG